MAAYFHGGAGTDIQASTDGLQTLYLMNPSYAGYADASTHTPAAANMMLLNSTVSTMTPASFGHQQSPSAAQHFVGIPLQAPPSGYNLWTPATTGAADMSPPQQTPGTAGVSAVLSLSSREAPPVTVAAVAGDEGKYLGASATSPGQMVMSSKYLKAAQELLDEVVSVSKGVEDAKTSAAAKSMAAVKKKEDSEGMSGGGTEDGGGAKSGAAAELSTAERQELQMKKSKLINMLDEVEQRYRQYHGQMQAVSSSFEAAAGAGSARTYTALALRTISRQFRCLRDAIAAQVRAASRALGEDADAAAGGRTVGSRLRYIDHQLRQQRALQQLGMMQGGAWRPQRGLPERSVSILRAWLFEHFLHPYPKDSDKIMLAKQTGLSRSQVSNWFINARVRLWKPMVEEMYLEETKNQEGGGGGGNGEGKPGGGSKSGDTNNSVDGVTPRAGGGAAMSKAAVRVAGGTAESASTKGVSGVHGSSLLELARDQQTAHGGFYDDEDDEEDDGSGGAAAMQRRFKKARGDESAAAAAGSFHHHHHVHDMAALHAQAAAAARQQHEEVNHRELLMKFMESGGGAGARDHHHNDGGGYSLFAPAPYGQFGSDQTFAFAGNGGVSLTLGLPHGAAAGEQTASFLMGGSTAGDSASHGAAGGYDMNMQSTKSFAAQLMRDFVA
ncbi:BEL1-like homeodomain protein 7 [Phragmites australis]|uniref:BEL1-like homeodomain protein 7 n=1 Tax=Phragmites australis TaxID=29695 RepID=UPI002D784185|nr:BEL1-like homeodomain protein 7 [Phragmites australis]XP_062197426.1 BEL1-like homeodomain protein 7 [Phragmites australis]XP_062197427.1 BEL1-like homeodomain protein 7 [Phragmites australis]XP_062197428.1 BEL1-like homeodomain protein 7 [Phragmites australis]